jgi:hypothetical protein
MPVVDPIIGMNLSSSQMELVQSWGLGHSGPNHPHVPLSVGQVH